MSIFFGFDRRKLEVNLDVLLLLFIEGKGTKKKKITFGEMKVWYN
jgi:hypothetical protein